MSNDIIKRPGTRNRNYKRRNIRNRDIESVRTESGNTELRQKQNESAETGNIETKSISEIVMHTYEKAFLVFSPEDKRKRIKSCERQIAQLERRIARKKYQENHQVLADMKELHKRAAAIGYTVTVYDTKLLKKFRHTLMMLVRLDLTFLKKMAAGAVAEDIVGMCRTAELLRTKSLYEIYKEDYMQYLVGQRIEELMGRNRRNNIRKPVV